MTFDDLRGQCLTLLRVLRSMRRGKGYQSVYGLLLVMREAAHELLEVHVLGRLSLSKFDSTCAQMQPTMRADAIMCETRILCGRHAP